jgi:hypothetical protein
MNNIELRLNDPPGSVARVKLHDLARADGFPTATAFFDFFCRTYGVTPDEPLCDMEIIKW